MAQVRALRVLLFLQHLVLLLLELTRPALSQARGRHREGPGHMSKYKELASLPPIGKAHDLSPGAALEPPVAASPRSTHATVDAALAAVTATDQDSVVVDLNSPASEAPFTSAELTVEPPTAGKERALNANLPLIPLRERIKYNPHLQVDKQLLKDLERLELLDNVEHAHNSTNRVNTLVFHIQCPQSKV